MDMRTSFDSRDDRHTYVGYVFQNLSALVVNLAPNAGIGNIAKRGPIDPDNEVAICTRQYDDLVCPILRNPMKGIHDLRMVLCSRSTLSVPCGIFHRAHSRCSDEESSPDLGPPLSQRASPGGLRQAAP
jgi:hypothetical protein